MPDPLFDAPSAALAAAQAAQASAESIANALRAALAAALAAQASAESIADTLKTSELQYRRLFETARDGILILDSDQGRITDANPYMTELLGYSHDELLGKELWEIGLHQNKEASQEAFQQLKQDHYIRYEGLPLENRRGEKREVEFVSNLYQEGGHTVIQCNIRDITERKTAENALRESEMRFRQTADTVPHIVWTALPDGSLDYYNQRWYDYTGLTFQETQGWGWQPVVHEEDLARTLTAYRSALEQVREYREEYRLQRADGEYRWYLGRAAPIKNEAGEVVKWAGTCTDITESKKADQRQAVLFQREHTIAEQLQKALQPPLPSATPGITVRSHYQAALTEEAGVGGDFYDCYVFGSHNADPYSFDTHDFAAPKACVALVVGDVSGKGLNAAAQVAAVRHGLRATLFLAGNIVEAVVNLNNILVEQQGLTGFATLFVGAYDSRSKTLHYVNCGQEPALLRRASTGTVEQLGMTGPILGTIENAHYTEARVTLAPGDALAIFSDGLTEVGPTRLKMLDIEGVKALFEESIADDETLDAAAKAERLASRLIAGVDSAAAGGVVRDDVCLLVAVVDGG